MLPERHPIPPESTRCSYSHGFPEQCVRIEVGPRDVPAVGGVFRVGVMGPNAPRQKIAASHSTIRRGTIVADRVDRPALPPCSVQLLLYGVGSDAETGELDAVAARGAGAGRTVAPPLEFRFDSTKCRRTTERVVAGDGRVAEIAAVGRVEPDLRRQVVVL